MTDKLPVVGARELIAILHRLGFREGKRSSGSHRHFMHPDGRKTLVPFHKGRDIGRGLLRKILRDIELPPSELMKMLRKAD